MAHHRGLAGQHARQLARAFDAAHLAGLVEQFGGDGHGHRLAGCVDARPRIRGRRQVVTPVRAPHGVDEACQFRHRVQHRADTLRLAPAAAVQPALQRVPVQMGQVAQALEQGQHLFPVLPLGRPFGAERLHHVIDRGIARLRSGAVDQAVQMPQHHAQHLARHRGAALRERAQVQVGDGAAQRGTSVRIAPVAPGIRQTTRLQRPLPARQVRQASIRGAAAAHQCGLPQGPGQGVQMVERRVRRGRTARHRGIGDRNVGVKHSRSQPCAATRHVSAPAGQGWLRSWRRPGAVTRPRRVAGA